MPVGSSSDTLTVLGAYQFVPERKTMSEQFAVSQRTVSPGWRPKLGLLLFILALVSPLLVPMVLATDLPKEVRGALAGLLLFGLPMALMLAVVGLIGQPAFAFIKRRIARQAAPPSAVSVTRYRIGLVLVIIAILVSWFEPLVSPHFPEIAARHVLIGASADALVLVGLCVLGGEFWDKLHALFVHAARAVADTPSGAAAPGEAVQLGWRFYVGVAFLLCTVLDWGLIPLASAAGWSTAKVASLTGGLLICNKVLLVTAIAVMGKPGFNHLKQLLLGFFRKFGPPQQVSRSRYRLGLILFMVPMLMTWIAPYVTGLLRPGSVYGFLQDLSLEVLLLVGLFVLGGDFWDKIRALFTHRAKVEIVAEGSASPT
jgi:hypothetical protein